MLTSIAEATWIGDYCEITERIRERRVDGLTEIELSVDTEVIVVSSLVNSTVDEECADVTSVGFVDGEAEDGGKELVCEAETVETSVGVDPNVVLPSYALDDPVDGLTEIELSVDTEVIVVSSLVNSTVDEECADVTSVGFVDGEAEDGGKELVCEAETVETSVGVDPNVVLPSYSLDDPVDGLTEIELSVDTEVIVVPSLVNSTVEEDCIDVTSVGFVDGEAEDGGKELVCEAETVETSVGVDPNVVLPSYALDDPVDGLTEIELSVDTEVIVVPSLVNSTVEEDCADVTSVGFVDGEAEDGGKELVCEAETVETSVGVDPNVVLPSYALDDPVDGLTEIELSVDTEVIVVPSLVNSTVDEDCADVTSVGFVDGEAEDGGKELVCEAETVETSVGVDANVVLPSYALDDPVDGLTEIELSVDTEVIVVPSLVNSTVDEDCADVTSVGFVDGEAEDGGNELVCEE
uniref:Uncharacterized protein n=1 Tax=Caenorhabditis japonica TaxID=281687 RepID=A0A8R1DLC2_CAEJA